MRLKAAIVGDLEKYMAEEVMVAEAAVTQAVRAASDGLKTDLRAQVTGAGLGQRLANSWRGRLYPQAGTSLSAATLVWSKAPKLMDVFGAGAVIRSRGGLWLAIPTDAAGEKRGAGFQGRLTPDVWERRTGIKLRMVYRKGAGTALLVADGARINSAGAAVRLKSRGRKKEGYFARKGEVTAVIFILVTLARLRRRLDIAAAGATWQGRLPGLILKHWRD